MEMEQRPPVIAKKLWNIMRIVFFMLRKGITKSKLMVDLHLMMKRGKIAGKAIGNLMFHHHSSFSCKSNDAHHSFVSPREYEFSCSNSPAYPSYYPFHLNKRKTHHHHNHRYYHNDDDDVTTVEASPLITLPGFGRSPMVRQLRITDSPFPLKDTEEDAQVDKAAEEFIKKFYKELKHQKKMAAFESPYHGMWVG
ncbi:hypothetical protein L1049_023043 [Liquidambar formosana]|uniref:Uncharacterized protein n=1 Tax=Liquidambar formosana TaxID=63359 RepID=A0AAP0RDY2_LIQFO